MNSGRATSQSEAAGLYRTGSGEWGVTLRTRGEGYEVVALRAKSGAPIASAADAHALAALFSAPREGVDRYPDWAEFEWRTRLGSARPEFDHVWRIAEGRHRVVFLGMAIGERGAEWPLPLAAALWRGWSRTPGLDPRALFWNSGAGAHLWLLHPFDFPRHITLGPDPEPAALVFALSSLARLDRLVLEVGGLSREYRLELEQLLPGELRSAEPFADLLVSPEVRDRLASDTDPTAYLPALGAARALLQGAPPVQRICESSPEAGAVDG